MRKDQDANFGGALEDLGHVLTSRTVTVGAACPCGEDIGEGGGGGGDVGVALSEVGLVVLRCRTKVGA